MSRQKDFQNSAERYADECGGTTQKMYKKLFDDAWKKHSIRVGIKPFPKYRNENGYYGYIYYRKKAMSILVFGQGKHQLLMKYVTSVLNQYNS